MSKEFSLEVIVALAKSRGFVYPGLKYTEDLQIHGTTAR